MRCHHILTISPLALFGYLQDSKLETRFSRIFVIISGAGNKWEVFVHVKIIKNYKPRSHSAYTIINCPYQWPINAQPSIIFTQVLKFQQDIKQHVYFSASSCLSLAIYAFDPGGAHLVDADNNWRYICETIEDTFGYVFFHARNFMSLRTDIFGTTWKWIWN